MITAVDVGATKTLIAQFGTSGKPVNELLFKTPHNADAFLDLLRHNLQQLNNITALSIGVPGVVNTKGTIERCGRLPWKNFPLKQLLSRSHHCPIFIENDAKMAALSEVNALKKIPHLGAYITVSTGIGIGIIVDGKLLDAFKQSEAGHMVFWHEGAWRTWQDFASGTALVNHYGKFAKDLADSEWSWAVEGLSVGLAALIPALQPDVIIFGGSVGNYFDRYSATLTEHLRQRLPAFIPLPVLKQAVHPSEAVLYGCYYYATHQQTA